MWETENLKLFCPAKVTPWAMDVVPRHHGPPGHSLPRQLGSTPELNSEPKSKKTKTRPPGKPHEERSLWRDVFSIGHANLGYCLLQFVDFLNL
jgi:hypothetical protein